MPYKQHKFSNDIDMRSLITQERSQKLDLLIHLLSNLQQSLVILGPKGIGKTTLLNLVHKKCQDRWWIYTLSATANLSFETIIINLNRFLNLSDSLYAYDIAKLRQFCQQQQLVLIIDDAGELVPGLISELMDLSHSLPGLRLVFAMTYDHFHLKRKSDQAIDDSHIIEIPPLDKQQCREFLVSLSVQPGSSLNSQTISESLVADLYRETHGLPGKILDALPSLNRFKAHKSGKFGLLVGGVSLICVLSAVAVSRQLNIEQFFDFNTKQTLQLAAKPTITPIAIPNLDKANADTASNQNLTPSDKTTVPTDLPVKISPAELGASENQTKILDQQNDDLMPKNNNLVQTPVVQPTTLPEEQELAVASSTSKPKASEPVIITPPVNSAINKAKNANSPEDNQEWILSQPSGNFTLQVMVLSNKNAAKFFVKKYPQYQDSLKYYAINKNDLEKYVIIYGSFTTLEEARQIRDTMPKEFQKAMEKRFRTVQNESNR